MDPPYWDTAGYGVPFPIDEYIALASRLRTIKGKAIVSLHDHPRMREVFDGLVIEAIDITYTVGGNASGVDHSADRRELVIFSWDRRP